MSQTAIHANSDLSELLLFQDNFISLVHSSLYHPQTLSQDALLKFEIHHISEANAKLNRMMEKLSRQLIDQKIPYELGLRDCFQRFLQADFLPLLRINRYELTKLSLFGFDIYVEPLEAVLQILSKIDMIKKRIIESPMVLKENETAESALQEGWDSYMCFTDQWKMSFNIYILQEYLRIGGKSFLKKDRQIVFTGINHLYNQLVPQLAVKQNIKLLKELAELNNSLYNFHPSFDYFQLYVLLLPLKEEVEPVFFLMNQILQKCLRTNILTPLLFGLLRHREEFLKFIDEVDSSVWLPYLNTLISGIAINLKFRILEYEEIIVLLQKSIYKAGILGGIRTQEIVGTLEDGWKDAKQFFISAVKIGFNSGEVQTWKTIDFEQIGQRVMAAVIDGMLLNIEQNSQIDTFLPTPKEKLSQQIKKLSENKLEEESIQNGICQLENEIKTQAQMYSLIRVANLIQLLKQENEYNQNFIICSILKISSPMRKIVFQNICKRVQKINDFLSTKSESGLTFIKENVIQLHKKYPPQRNTENIIKFYFQNYEPKKSFSTLMEILLKSPEDSLSQLSGYVSKTFSLNSTQKLVKMRTFERELLVRSDLVNPSYQNHCIISVLVIELTKKNKSAQNLIHNIIQTNPEISFSLLNFPINENGRLFSFGTFLIQNSDFHDLLKQILRSCRGAIISEEGVDLIEALSYPSIREQIYKRINEVEKMQQLYLYSNLLLWVFQETEESENNCRQLLAIYLYIFQKNSSLELIKDLIKDISQLAVYAFKEKLQNWFAFLLSRKIEGKFDVQRITRKRVLKITGSSIYFINEIPQNQIDDARSKITERKQQSKIQTKTKSSQELQNEFWSTFERLKGCGLEQLLKINQKQHIIFQQQLKILYISELSETFLKQLSSNLTKDEHSSSKVINFVGVNTENYIRLVQLALEDKNYQYLMENRYIGRLNTKIPAILTLSSETNVNVLKEMSVSLSVSEKQKIADGFFLESSLLSSYVQFIEGIEYLVLYNNLNWRVLIDNMSKSMSSSNLASLVLQYNEYLTITGQPNAEYQSVIQKNADMFRIYSDILIQKLRMIFKAEVSAEELQLKSVNELTYLNLVLSSLQMREIVCKLGTLHKNMKERKILHRHTWISNIKALNTEINRYFQGNVLPPDFLNSYCLTNEEVLNKHKTELGVILQKYYEELGELIPEDEIYLPSPKNGKIVPFGELSGTERKVLDRESGMEESEKNWSQVLEKLGKMGSICFEEEEWEIDYEHVGEKEEELNLFYSLGCLYACKAQKLPPLLEEMIQRRKLSWEVVKSIRSEQYHHIKSVLVEPEMTSRQLFFMRDEQELIPKGQQVRVNEYNRDIYCHKCALKVIGTSAWKCATEFLKGFTNQQAQK